LPTHSSQASHVFKQPVTGVHGRHFVGSETSARVQVPSPAASSDPIHTYEPLPAGSSQHPKQSQPFGVSAPPVSWQVWLWLTESSAQDAVQP
jgi:hypothetical protein